MRNILRYIVCACLALALGGCIKDEIVGNSFCREGLLSLNIGINETRAAGDNDNGNADLTDEPLALNENRIDNYEVFLFASGATGEAKFSAYFSGVNAFDSTTNNAISVPAGALAELFGSGDTCNIYVVANLGKSLATELKNASTPLTLANLKAHIVSADFTTPEVIVGWDISKYNSAPIQPNFVMDSTGTDTVTKSGNNLSGEVYITRAASKISFMAYIGESMTIDGKVWIPDLENIKVAFNNVVEKGAIDNGSDTEDTFSMPQVEGLYKDLSGVQLITDDNVYTQTPEFEGVVQGVSSWQKVGILVPFYTYSSIWNANENKVDPSIVLTVPWFVEDNKTTTLTNYNYTIPLTAANGDLKLVRNKHYRIALRVGVLGDLDQLASSEFSYEVLDWVGNDINVDLSDPKYLVVEKDYVEMNNLTSVSVPYTSSDAVSAKITKVTRYNLSDAVAKNVEYTTVDAWNNINGKPFIITPSADGNPNGSVVLSHDFVVDSTDPLYDYVPYYIYVTVTNESGFEEEIVFVQYPPIYITASQNSDYGDGSGADEYNSYYTMVNAYYTDQGGDSYTKKVDTGQSTGLGSVPGLYVSGGQNSSTNANPNSYLITISSLGSNSNNVLGDPRQSSVDTELINLRNGSNNYWVVTQSVDYDFNITKSPTRSLTWYYPTIRDNTTKNMIAPKYRVASSYSVVHTGVVTSVDMAERRCAAYQEDGWPAGRWRLPTFAEVEFIYNLSERNRIPILFNEGTPYWCAQGAIQLSNNVVDIVNSTANSVRCVYDVWYWGDEQLPQAERGNFTWGDMAR